ncbi:MAG TPA: NAD(P)-binding domain-containing protein [Thermoplasmata archaeon]|nr:NAD(P)-binding domain-containing protein [Thermoplasmata archaeon]
MKVGILGSGEVALRLGTSFMAAGHDVKLGTRHPNQPQLVEWTAKAGPKGSVGSFTDAATFGEVVVLATQGVSTPEAIRAAGLLPFDGKVVIDATNPLAPGPDGTPHLAPVAAGSNGEAVQALLPKARVVKAFNIIGNAHMFHPTFPGGPPDMFICGNDDAAKRTVEGILHEFGWSTVIDIGGIEGSRELEALCILWVKSATRLGNWDIGFKLLRK